MDFIITFFRDILDGPVYIVVTVICSILICACIGYLAEKRQNKKKEKEQYVEVSNVSVSSGAPISTSIDSTVPNIAPVEATLSVSPQVVQTPIASSNITNSSMNSVSNVHEPGVAPISETVDVSPTSNAVQIEKPQVVTIPVTDSQAAVMTHPQEVYSSTASVPTGVPSMQVAPTAPSVSTVGKMNLQQQVTTPQVPTSVNQQ